MTTRPARRNPVALALLATGLAVLAITLGGTSARGAVSLGTATSFAVLANTTITNTGASTINGDVGLYPGTAVTGFGTVTRSGALHVANAVAQQALVDAGATYQALQGRTPCMDLTGEVLGQTVGTAAKPLMPGVYCFTSSAQLTGDLYLSGGGEYVFRIGSTLTTASGSHVILQSGAEACNVFWAVGSSATLGTNSRIAGTIVANVSITANTGAVVDGRLFALTGAVTLDANTIGGMNCPPASTTTTAAPATTTTTTVAAPATTTTVAAATTTTAPVTTTTAPGATTTTAAPGTTTTTATAAGTTTTPAPAPTTTAPQGTTTGLPGTIITQPTGATTTGPGAEATTTTVVPATTSTLATTTTTTPTVGTGSMGTGQATPSGPAIASPRTTTASLGALLAPAVAGLSVQPLARTGQGLSGPLSLATTSIFLGALLLLAQRRRGASAMAAPQPSRHGHLPGSVDHLLVRTSSTMTVPPVVDDVRSRVRTPPGAGPPTPRGTQRPGPSRQAEPPSSGPGDLVAALERQLQAADARLARLRANGWRG